MRCKHKRRCVLSWTNDAWQDYCASYNLIGAIRCSDCGAWLSLGPANDTIAGNEFSLAEDIADLCILWEPGKEREQRIGWIVDVHVLNYGVAKRGTP